jgi:hypothetical protein
MPFPACPSKLPNPSTLATDAVWHPRHDEDPGHAWMRAAIKKAMSFLSVRGLISRAGTTRIAEASPATANRLAASF